MTAHTESRIVPYTAELMYAVVADVEHYPDFLPWCQALRLKGRKREGDKEIVAAEMVVGFKGFRERYTSRIMLDPAARTIEVTQSEGVFRHLENDWRFTPEGDHCRIEFSIDFEFKNRLLGAVAGQTFAHVMTRMSTAFEARAKVLSEQAALRGA
ncbi:MAG: type II toxin-antitoxin system RatA family toxin [Pseudomonadota bacterium]|nr:type II toxin-antitoxin system RatA family toxin [Pseudomonadota bacterium]